MFAQAMILLEVNFALNWLPEPKRGPGKTAVLCVRVKYNAVEGTAVSLVPGAFKLACNKYGKNIFVEYFIQDCYTKNVAGYQEKETILLLIAMT